MPSRKCRVESAVYNCNKLCSEGKVMLLLSVGLLSSFALF